MPHPTTARRKRRLDGAWEERALPCSHRGRGGSHAEAAGMERSGDGGGMEEEAAASAWRRRRGEVGGGGGARRRHLVHRREGRKGWAGKKFFTNKPSKLRILQ